MRQRHLLVAVVGLILGALLLVGCGSGESEPVTVTVKEEAKAAPETAEEAPVSPSDEKLGRELGEEERDLSAVGAKARREADAFLAAAERCNARREYACVEAEATAAEAASRKVEAVARGLNEVHRRINHLPRGAIEIAVEASMGEG